MTVQAPDLVRVDGEELALLQLDGHGLFDPAQHGLEPALLSTAAWRGYLCTYAVEDDRLLLDRLLVAGAATVGGVAVHGGAPLLGAVAVATSTPIGRAFAYEGLAHPVRCTGRLLLGRDVAAPVLELDVEAGTVRARRTAP